MEESQEEAMHREDVLQMHRAIEEALKIISDITLSTVNTPTPAPVNDDWQGYGTTNGHTPPTQRFVHFLYLIYRFLSTQLNR